MPRLLFAAIVATMLTPRLSLGQVSAGIAGSYRQTSASGSMTRHQRTITIIDFGAIGYASGDSSASFAGNGAAAGLIVVGLDGSVHGSLTTTLQHSTQTISTKIISGDSKATVFNSKDEVPLTLDLTGSATEGPPGQLHFTLTATAVPSGYSSAAVSFSTSSTVAPDGTLTFRPEIDDEVLAALGAANPGSVFDFMAQPSGTFVGGLPDTTVVRQPWKISTPLQFALSGGGLTSGALEPRSPEYHLINVPAPYGYIATGDWGLAAGNQTILFRYGSQSLEVPIESGIAENTFDYGDIATVIEGDIRTDGVLVDTISRPLTKVPAPAWAPSGQWSASPGVEYRTTLNWPVSLEKTSLLSDVPVLSGLWGIVGGAASSLEAKAHSLGAAREGTLTSRIRFTTGLRTHKITFGGKHNTTLDPSGVRFAGSGETSAIGYKWDQSITPVAVIPGLAASLGHVHPLITNFINSTGLVLQGRLRTAGTADYEALPGDAMPRFTSGWLIADASLHARLYLVPKFLHNFVELNAGVGIGGCCEMSFTEPPAITRMGGYVEASFSATLFGRGPSVTRSAPFGDDCRGSPPPPPLFAPAPAFALPAPPPPPISTAPPPLAHVHLHANTDQTAIATWAEPDWTDGGTSRLGFAFRGSGDDDTWSVTELESSTSAVCTAPTFGTVFLLPREPSGVRTNAGLLAWARNTTTKPADESANAAYANQFEIVARPYDSNSSRIGDFQTEIVLTANSACDFGPQVLTTDDHARVLWTRCDGTDFSGVTTPISLHERRWVKWSTDPALAWTTEAQIATGLTHVIDWRATVHDDQNAAIVLVRDTDGDYATLDDTEIWLVREISGTWQAPVRLTDDAVNDQTPIIAFSTTGQLALGWDAGGSIVGTLDYDTAPTATPWFDADTTASLAFPSAELTHRASGWLLLIPAEAGVLWTDQEWGPAALGSAWPALRHMKIGRTPSALGVSTTTSRVTVVASLTDADTSDPFAVPTALPQQLAWYELSDAQADRTLFLTNLPEALEIAVGQPVLLEIATTGPADLDYQWYYNDIPIPGATGPALEITAAVRADSGAYHVSVTSPTSTVSSLTCQLHVGQDDFPSWAAAHALIGADALPSADPDRDGKRNDLEYLCGTDPTMPDATPGLVFSPGLPLTGDLTDMHSLTFRVSRELLGVAWVLEASQNLTDWTPVDPADIAIIPKADHLLCRVAISTISPAVVPNSLAWLAGEPNAYFRIRLVSGP